LNVIDSFDPLTQAPPNFSNEILYFQTLKVQLVSLLLEFQLPHRGHESKARREMNPPFQQVNVRSRFGKHLARVFWVKELPMMKISIIEGHTERRLIVEGKLVWPWAAELRNECEKANADLFGRKLVIDMRHVTAISQEAENLLFELIQKKV
jgi:hypothetical protein